MGNAFHVAAAIAIGVCVALQPPINAVMARVLGSPMLAASISIAISLVLAVLLWWGWAGGAGDLANARALPWWVVIGGLAGAVFVAGGVIVAPAVGVATFFVCVVAGQLLGAAVADHLGAFGMPVKPISAMKALGLALVIAGAIVVRRAS